MIASNYFLDREQIVRCYKAIRIAKARLKRVEIKTRIINEKEDIFEAEDELIFKWVLLLGISSMSFVSTSEEQFIQKLDDSFPFS